MWNPGYVNFFDQGLPFKQKSITIENKRDQCPTFDESVTIFKLLKNHSTENNLANEMTLKSSNGSNYLKSHESYSHQSHSQTRYRTDSDKKVAPQLLDFADFLE